MSRIIAAFRLNAHERLDQTAQPALQFDMTLQRNEANTTVLVVDNGIVLDSLVGLVEITGAVAAEMVAESAFEHASPLGTGVAVPRQFGARPSLEHKDAHAVVRRDIDRAPLHATSDPAPRTQIVTRQWLGKFARGIHVP